MNIMRVVLVGGGGFIGSHLCELFLSQGHEVVVLDLFTRDSLRFLPADERSRITILRGDVTDVEMINYTVRSYRPHIIINLASMAGIETVEANPIMCMKTNMLGPLYLCEASVKYNVKKLIHVSSSEVYGETDENSNEDSVTKTGRAGDARWTYAASKCCADHLVMSYLKERGLNACVVRPFNIYGPRQTGHGAISHFIFWALHGENLKIYGDGEQVRAWCNVKDIITAFDAIIQQDYVGLLNIGNPNYPMTIIALAKAIIEETHSKSETFHATPRPVDIKYRVPNITRVKEKLGWQPTVSFIDGLRETIKWYSTTDLSGIVWRKSLVEGEERFA